MMTLSFWALTMTVLITSDRGSFQSHTCFIE
jgi:hypothetical protein